MAHKQITPWTEDTVGGSVVAAPWSPVSLARYAVLASYTEAGRATIGQPTDTRPLPETGTTLQPGASLAWARRRRRIVVARDTVEARRLDRAFAAGAVMGSPALKADRDHRAHRVPGYGRYHIDG